MKNSQHCGFFFFFEGITRNYIDFSNYKWYLFRYWRYQKRNRLWIITEKLNGQILGNKPIVIAIAFYDYIFYSC